MLFLFIVYFMLRFKQHQMSTKRLNQKIIKILILKTTIGKKDAKYLRNTFVHLVITITGSLFLLFQVSREKNVITIKVGLTRAQA